MYCQLLNDGVQDVFEMTNASRTRFTATLGATLVVDRALEGYKLIGVDEVEKI